MKQILCGRSEGVPSGSNWTGLFGSINIRSFESQARCPWLVAGTFRNFRVKINTAPGSGKSWAFTINKNGSPTSVVATISDTDTEGSDTTNSFAVVAGDYLALQWTATNTPANTAGMSLSVEFESGTDTESGYAQVDGQLSDTTARRTGVFWPTYQSASLDTWQQTLTGASIANILPTSGTITGLYVRLSFSPGGGIKGYECAIYKALAASPTSFVKQDGSGGTPDTRTTCSGATVTASSSFSLAVAAGDRVYVECTPQNTPNVVNAGIAVSFDADIAGESIIGGFINSSIGTGAVTYLPPGNELSGGSATETSIEQVGNPNSFQLGKFHFAVDTAPGSSKSWVFLVRENLSTPSSPLSITIADSATVGSDLVRTLLVSDGDTFDVQSTPTGNPANAYGSWSMVQNGVGIPIIGSLVVGVDGQVTSSLTVLDNLDGVPRSVDAETSHVIGGNLMLLEQASAPAGIANSGRMYTEDNGSGKTRLMVQFGTGSPVQIAIEP